MDPEGRTPTTPSPLMQDGDMNGVSWCILPRQGTNDRCILWLLMVLVNMFLVCIMTPPNLI